VGQLCLLAGAQLLQQLLQLLLLCLLLLLLLLLQCVSKAGAAVGIVCQHSTMSEATYVHMLPCHVFTDSSDPVPQKGSAEVCLSSYLTCAVRSVLLRQRCQQTGGLFTDSMGRHSKRLQLQGGKQVVVRKMACHSGFAYGALRIVALCSALQPLGNWLSTRCFAAV
jgi:hypothetical protein